MLPNGLAAQIGLVMQNTESCNTPFISTWDTNNTNGGAGNTVISLPLVASGNYQFTADWGDGTTSVITNANMATTATHTYASAGIKTLTLTGKIEGWKFDNNTEKLKITNISQWGCLKGAGNAAFFGCANLTVGATDILNLEGITDLSRQFQGCTAITTLDVKKWDVSSNTNFSNQFFECSSLTSLELNTWNVSNVTNFSGQFRSCSALKVIELDTWNVSKGETFSNQFRSCIELTTLDVANWKPTQGTNFGRQFRGCTLLTTIDIKDWTVDNAAGMKEFMRGTKTTTAIYDAALIKWAAILPTLNTNNPIHFGGSKYTSTDAAVMAARQAIIDKGWVLTDGGAL